MQTEDVSLLARPELPSHTAGAGDASAWYCARTKPKNEHIAAANVRVNLGLEVFLPRLRSKQRTCRGVVRTVTEPVFPGYIFVRCEIGQCIDQLRHTSGISSIVNFGKRIPSVPETAIVELQECFGMEDLLDFDKHPAVGDGVRLYAGAFFGIQAVVLRSWPARRRVQVLLDILGRPTPLEVDSSEVQVENKSMAELLPILAASQVAFAAG